MKRITLRLTNEQARVVKLMQKALKDKKNEAGVVRFVLDAGIIQVSDWMGVVGGFEEIMEDEAKRFLATVAQRLELETKRPFSMHISDRTSGYLKKRSQDVSEEFK